MNLFQLDMLLEQLNKEPKKNKILIRFYDKKRTELINKINEKLKTILGH